MTTRVPKILLLGGTADARRLVETLHLKGYKVVYSIAGLVRTPRLDCEILVGGFTQFGGLANYLAQQSIDLVINGTHPYAVNMSNKAAQTSHETGIPVWRFLRPPWQSEAQDQWLSYADEESLLTQLQDYHRPLLSAGQMTESFVQRLVALPSVEQVLWRTAVPPKFELPKGVIWEKAIGPFSLADEQALLTTHCIDVIVSKNSGGDATSAKLLAARQKGIPVLLHQRPQELKSTRLFTDLTHLVSELDKHYPVGLPQQQDMQQQ